MNKVNRPDEEFPGWVLLTIILILSISLLAYLIAYVQIKDPIFCTLIQVPFWIVYYNETYKVFKKGA